MTSNLIKKYQAAIQEYVNLVKETKGRPTAKQIKLLVKKHAISSTTSQDILRADIVSRVSRGLYKVNFDKIEPIHTRRVIDSRRKYLKSIKQKSNLKPIVTNIIKEYKPIEPNYVLDKKVKERSVSILWGIFKIKF